MTRFHDMLRMEILENVSILSHKSLPGLLAATSQKAQVAGIRSGNQETRGFCERCGRIHWGIFCPPVSRCFSCGQECDYSRNSSMRKLKVCFFCN